MLRVMPAVIAANSGPLFDDEPWIVNVHVFMTPSSHTNFSANTVDSSYVYNAYRVSSGAQNDEINFEVLLAAGTWTFELIHGKDTSHGIFDVQIDGSSIGTIDAYAASAQVNVRSQITGVSVAATGKKTLKLIMSSKNASSTNYYGVINHIQFKRTA